MKKYYKLAALISVAFLVNCFKTSGQAQTNKTLSSLQKTKSPSLNWYTTAKLSFLQSQKIVNSTEVMARKNFPGGNYNEIGPGFLENQTEKLKSSTNQSFEEGKVICKASTKEMDLSIKPEFNILKASSQTKIFPGIIFTDQSVLDESLITASGLPTRKSMTLNISIPGAAVSSVVLDQPGLIQMDKVNTLLTQNYGKTIPAMAGLSMTEVDSKFDFAAQVETSSGLFLPLEEFGIPAEVNAGAAFSGNVTGETKRKTYIIKFIQPMFILFHNDPNAANIFQDPSVASSKKNLVMVNSVTYGRMVFIRLVSEANAGDVKTALEGKLGIQLTELNIKAGHSVEGSGSASFNSVVEEFKAIVVGGNNNTGMKVIANPDQLKSYLEDPTAKKLNANTGPVPISFTMVRVSDYASLGIRSVGTFEAIEGCKTMEKYAVYIKNFGVNKVVDNPLAGNNEDLYGTISVNAYYKNASGTDVEIKDELNRSAAVWSQGSSSPLQLKEGESHNLYVAGSSAIKDGVRKFIFSPDQIANGYITIKYRIKDKIMKDGEDLGNSNEFVRYEEKDFKFFLNEWADLKDVSGCTYVLKEIGGDAKICVNFSKYRE